jgi:hypothetical protein
MTTMVTIGVFIQPITVVEMTGMKLIRIRKRNADFSPYIIVVSRNFDARTDIADYKNCQNKPSHNLIILLKPVSKGKREHCQDRQRTIQAALIALWGISNA